MSDPVARHAAALEALDRNAAQVEANRGASLRFYSPLPEPLRYAFDSIAAALAGRRRILERHPPCANCGVYYDHPLPVCHKCATSWPCDDWLDASAGLGVPDGA